MEKKTERNSLKEEETKISSILVSKKPLKEERRKTREKKKAQTGPPLKMNLYLYFVLFFAGIVTFFDGWCTLAITLAMGSIGGGGGGGQIDLLQQIINPDLFSYFGLSLNRVMMGFLLSISGIGIVLAVSFKYFVDKYGRRPLALITAVAFITFSTLTGLSPPGPSGIIVFLSIRIFADYFLSADIVTIIIAEESPDHLRGRLVGVVLASNTAGGFICGIIQMVGVRIPISGAWGPSLSTWQSLFFLTSFGYIIIIPMFFFLKETWRFNSMKKYEQWRKNKGLKSKIGWFVPLQKQYYRPMTLGSIMGFLTNLIYFAQVTFFGLYFAKELNMATKTVGLASLPLMLAAGIGFYIAGPLMDRWGRIPTIHRFGCTTLIGGAIFSWPTIFICGDIANPFIMCLVVVGGMIGVLSTTVLLTASILVPLEMLPTHIRSTAMGWIYAISRGALILAPFILMFGAEKLGGLGITYQAMFALMGMPLTTILFSAYLLAPESKGRDLEEIVITEIYAKQKIVHGKEYRRPYYYFFISLTSFFFTSLIYGQTTGASFPAIVIISIFYTVVCLVCFLIVIYVRNIITK